LKITPVANEIVQLSEELEMSSTDVMWIVAQIIDNNDVSNGQEFARLFEEEEDNLEDDWDEVDIEGLEAEMDQAKYSVNIKIHSSGKFPEMGFKAGINEKEDIHYFFDMVMEMLDKLE
jgi:hypothetical protein